MNTTCIISVILIVVVISLLLWRALYRGIKYKNNIEVSHIAKNTFDFGLYTILNYQKAEKILASYTDGWSNKKNLPKTGNSKIGGCTAIQTILDDGTPIVGRNMDFAISNYPTVIGKVCIPDKNKVNFVSKLALISPKSKQLSKFGIKKDVYEIAPLCATDTMNDKGLYAEVNMRLDEQDKDGNYVFGSDGTNPRSGNRVSSISVAMLISLNCTTVKDAIEYVKTLNIYSCLNKKFAWTGAVMFSDKCGDCALIELGKNKLSVLKHQYIQTNFYIDKKFERESRYKIGLGRYEYAKKSQKHITSIKAMQEVLSNLYYGNLYSDSATWNNIDWLSEFVGSWPRITNKYLEDPKNIEKLIKIHKWIQRYNLYIPESVRRTLSLTWETTYSIVANCRNSTMLIRFNQDDNFEKVLDFD